MKTKEIIVTCLVALALLSGCNKEKESTSTSTTSKSVTTPAPAEEPATTKTQRVCEEGLRVVKHFQLGGKPTGQYPVA